MKPSLYKLEKQLSEANTLRALNQALQDYLESLHISTFAFTYYAYSPSSINKLKYDFTSSNFSSWHKHYISEGYEDIDSTLDIVYQATMPIFWDTREQFANAKNPRERKMRKDSIAFGAEKGISIPIHGPHDDFAILLVVQMKGQNCLERYKDFQDELFLAGYHYYHHLQKQLLQTTANKKFKLSQREMQCLTLIAKNYSTEDMAKILGIKERTVNYHIQRLNKKFGTSNKYQSVIKALNKGLIKL